MLTCIGVNGDSRCEVQYILPRRKILRRNLWSNYICLRNILILCNRFNVLSIVYAYNKRDVFEVCIENFKTPKIL